MERREQQRSVFHSEGSLIRGIFSQRQAKENFELTPGSFTRMIDAG